MYIFIKTGICGREETVLICMCKFSGLAKGVDHKRWSIWHFPLPEMSINLQICTFTVQIETDTHNYDSQATKNSGETVFIRARLNYGH